MKYLLSLCVALLTVFGLRASADWKMHNTFDEEVTRLIDTGDYVYFISRTQPYNKNVEISDRILFSLFRYDKAADELMSLSTDNLLSANVVSCVEYSPEKRMLVVVYDNYDIDLLYDNGEVANIPAYRLAEVTSKNVNSIFIDAEADRVYLSTGFGYVALNDKKREVAESRNYGTPVAAMSRIGDNLLLLTDSKLYSAPVKDPRYGLQDYSEVRSVAERSSLVSLDDATSLLMARNGSRVKIYTVASGSNGYEIKEAGEGTIYNAEHTPSGVTLTDSARMLFFSPGGAVREVALQADDRGMAAASRDGAEFWFAKMREGLRSKRYQAGSDPAWTLTRDFMAPNAPAPFMASEMVWHKDYGLLVSNHGYDWNFHNHEIDSPILLSAYRGGNWSNLSPVYTSKETVPSLMNPNGLAVDPDNPDLVYFGSVKFGLERINLKDGSDILHLSRTSDPYKDLPGFVEIVPDQRKEPSPALGGDYAWREQCLFSAPKFDVYGNMWTAHCDYNDQSPLQTHIYVWEAADRRASTDATSIRPPKRLAYPGFSTGGHQFVQPLTSSRNKDIVLWALSTYNEEVALIHTNGTPADTSDDKIVKMTTFTDQDGVDFEVHYVRTFFEDPVTGYVWVGHHQGVFYFNPADWLDGKVKVTRIKVPRNDGSNLADYLLDQVPVVRIAVDGKGRKWFATSGAGVVCTASDGRSIEMELNTGNSSLPDDMVYGLGYVADTNSMMFSTDNGIAEYFLPASAMSDSKAQARAYPNPVRPDYFGYVTIDGIPEGSLVKIADVHGNLVKDLGYISGGETQWDVTDLSFRRVGSGVYYILTSTDDNLGKQANVGKILVVN